METTTIQITEQTLKRLKFFKEYYKESYNELINKIMNLLEEGELTEMATKKIISGLKDVKEGRVISLEAYARKRGIAGK
ncbi:hypothetical protein HZB88_03340 [archaeon]|nr:hypothetical protein [archaeon]